jgi:hypothetical protein
MALSVWGTVQNGELTTAIWAMYVYLHLHLENREHAGSPQRNASLSRVQGPRTHLRPLVVIKIKHAWLGSTMRDLVDGMRIWGKARGRGGDSAS